MRILDGGGVTLQMADLGYGAEDCQQLQEFIERPYGMVLVTGPTGSGKTTTLYTALQQIDADARSAAYFDWDTDAGRVTQIIADPDGHQEWRVEATIDLHASRDAGEAILVLDDIRAL